MDTDTSMTFSDFVLVHEYGAEKELVKLPEGSSVFPSKMHGEVAKQYVTMKEATARLQGISK